MESNPDLVEEDKFFTVPVNKVAELGLFVLNLSGKLGFLLKASGVGLWVLAMVAATQSSLFGILLILVFSSKSKEFLAFPVVLMLSEGNLLQSEASSELLVAPLRRSSGYRIGARVVFDSVLPFLSIFDVLMHLS